MRLTIPINLSILGVAALWFAAAALMVWDIHDGPRISEIGRAALLIGMGATTWTMVLAMKHCRRVILEVMSREHLMQMVGADDEEQRARPNVRALR